MPIIGNPIYQSAFVVDQFSGNGSTVAFTMSVAPAGVTNVLVAVSGVLQDPSTYGVVGNTITFSAAPPSGTGNISCRYLGVPVTGVTTTAYRTVTEFTATASQTTFTPPSYTPNFISVYLNGVLLGSADYTATNGTTVVLATGAAAGNLVTVESFLVSSVLNAIPNTAGSVSSANIANDVTINFADGSASTPSITNDGDTNTGMFFPAADTIAFAEGGVEGMRLTSNGNLLVGGTTSTDVVLSQIQSGNTSATSAGFQILNSTTGTGGLYYGDSTTGGARYQGYIEYLHSSDAMSFGTNIAERMRIDSEGRVTTPSQPSFHVRVNNAAYITTSPVPFSNAVFNTGGNFNTSTYRFTAPIAGKYYFVLNFYLQLENNEDGYPQYRVNGGARQYSYAYNAGTGGQIDITVAMNAIFDLSVGDYVDVVFSTSGGTGRYYGGNQETNFFGYLLG